ncbi:unnamed protein product [Pleuronectes platessa]|uniref:Uncharacterized protein n=1 Tax=Pleuronectes platessa TaxID=8262 RepID=A0A9N7TZV4_PLEPL|nr:unnamed protein product [Pleuronectes platessa]
MSAGLESSKLLHRSEFRFSRLWVFRSSVLAVVTLNQIYRSSKTFTSSMLAPPQQLCEQWLGSARLPGSSSPLDGSQTDWIIGERGFGHGLMFVKGSGRGREEEGGEEEEDEDEEDEKMKEGEENNSSSPFVFPRWTKTDSQESCQMSAWERDRDECKEAESSSAANNPISRD